MAAIAEKLGVTEATAQRYETGHGIKTIPYDVIEKYANIFNCSPSYLMGWDQDQIDALTRMQDELSAQEDALEEEIKSRLATLTTEQLARLNDILGLELNEKEMLDLFDYATFIVSKRKVGDYGKA